MLKNNPGIRKICITLGVLAVLAALVVGILALDAYGDVLSFRSNHETIESHASAEKLVRINEMKEVFQEVVPDTCELVDHYVNFWMDGGYTAVYRVLVRHQNGDLEVKEYELSSMLASNVAAYYYGISDHFPSLLRFDRYNELVISPSDPLYDSFHVYTTEYVFEMLNN